MTDKYIRFTTTTDEEFIYSVEDFRNQFKYLHRQQAVVEIHTKDGDVLRVEDPTRNFTEKIFKLLNANNGD